MPVKGCSNGLWRIGGGPCRYKSKESAEKAYAAYRAIVHSGECISPRIAAVLERLTRNIKS